MEIKCLERRDKGEKNYVLATACASVWEPRLFCTKEL